jgi:hypothetical protein
MALQGNFVPRGRPRSSGAPKLRSSVRHGDRMVLAGQPVPERFSRRKIGAMRKAGMIDG